MYCRSGVGRRSALLLPPETRFIWYIFAVLFACLSTHSCSTRTAFKLTYMLMPWPYSNCRCDVQLHTVRMCMKLYSRCYFQLQKTTSKRIIYRNEIEIYVRLRQQNNRNACERPGMECNVSSRFVRFYWMQIPEKENLNIVWCCLLVYRWTWLCRFRQRSNMQENRCCINRAIRSIE